MRARFARDGDSAATRVACRGAAECRARYGGRNVRGFVTLDFDIDRDGTVLRGELAGCALLVPTGPGDAQTEMKLSLELAESN